MNSLIYVHQWNKWRSNTPCTTGGHTYINIRMYVNTYNVLMNLFEEISAHYYIMHVCCCIMYTYYYTMHIYYCIIKFYTNLYCMYVTLHNILYVCPLYVHSPILHTTMYTEQAPTHCMYVHTCVYTAAIAQYNGLFPVGSRQTRGHHCMVGYCFVHTPNSCWIAKHSNTEVKVQVRIA